MSEPINVQTNPVLTLQVDLVSLLREGGLLNYDEETEQSEYAPDFESSIVKAAADKITKNFARDEIQKAIKAQVEAQVHEAVAAALDQVVTETDSWGKPKGEPKSLRQALAERAASEVELWMKKGNGYGSNSSYQRFLSDEVGAAVAVDLKGVLADARADVKARMEQVAAKAIADAAASVVKGL